MHKFVFDTDQKKNLSQSDDVTIVQVKRYLEMEDLFFLVLFSFLPLISVEMKMRIYLYKRILAKPGKLFTQ